MGMEGELGQCAGVYGVMAKSAADFRDVQQEATPCRRTREQVMWGIGSAMGVFRLFGLAGLLAVAPTLAAQSTAFTYQGQLEVAGSQASSYDFQADVFPQACSVEP